MFSRPLRRPALHRDKSVLFLVASHPAAIVGELVQDEWLWIKASSAEQALADAQELTAAGQQPDVLLLELGQPALDGFALWSRLQQLRGWDAIPCIFLGASADESVILQAFEAGASDYFHAPFVPSMLADKLRGLTGREVIAPPQCAKDVVPEMIFDARYRILHKIGRGGTSEVFLAEDLLYGVKRALKLFAPKGHEEVAVEQERFRREIRAQIRLRHPNLIKVYDIGFVGRLYYYTMDYLSGRSLAHRILEGPLPPKQALWIAERIASALQELHKYHLQHRDIKPGNILFSEAGDPILTDFGIVLDSLAPRLTHPEIVIGTPSYMSPERLTLEEQIDLRSDIYSTGLLLYEMLAGQLPYAGKDMVQMHRMMMSELPPPTIYQPNIPQVACDICKQATRYHPAQRYPDAAAMEEALAAALAEMTEEKVLLLDNDPMVTSLFATQLRALDIECKVVANGQEGIALARAWQPDICILNVNRTALGGIDMYQQLRRTPHLSQTTCLFLAPQWTEESALRAMRMGAKECLSKPFSIRPTAQKIKQMLNRAQHSNPIEALQTRTVINGRYELARLLQRGRYSLVYLVLDRQTGSPCVLKTLQPAHAAKKVAQLRILREMEVLKACRHPHIIHLRGVGRYLKTPYFIAPYIEGETLLGCLQRRETLPFPAALALTARLASALRHLHKLSLLHGRLTTGNVLLSEVGKPTLIDLGDAIHMQTGADFFPPHLDVTPTREEPIPQSVWQSMAPERLAIIDQPDGRSDIYSLGLLFYQMLTGIAPFAGCTTKEAVYKMALQGIPSPLKYQPYLPKGIEQICTKMLTFEPAYRYATAADVESDCLQLLRQSQRKRR